jgi:hypothetical protein
MLELAEGEEVVFYGAYAIQTPTVGGDALGELDLHGAFGREVLDQGLGKFVVGGAIFVSHGGDLTRDAVAQCVHAGAPSSGIRPWPLTSGAFRSISIAGIRPDRFIGLGVGAVGCDLFI